MFTEGTNYVLYTGLAPTAGGGISGYFEALADHEAGVFSGFQLVEVPEPATLSVLALGALAMLRRAARH